MEHRVTALETRLDTILPTLATKADMGELRADFERGQKENRAWMLATVLALFLGILSVGSFLRDGSKAPTPTSAPVIIQVPAYPAPLREPPLPAHK
jgi:hypothetical protein